MTSNGRERAKHLKQYAGWVCATNWRFGQCESKQISVTYIDALVGSAIGILLKWLENDIVRAARKAPQLHSRKTKKGMRSRLEGVRRRTVDLYTQGYIEKREFIERVTDIDEKRAGLDGESEPEPAAVPRQMLQVISSIGERWTEVPANEKRGLLLQLGAEITVNTSGEPPLWIEFRCKVHPSPIRVAGKTLNRWGIRILP